MKRCIPQEILKLIACISMLIDHTGAALFPKVLWLRIVGRVAFPIYCFLLVEGMRHTRNPEKYLLRLIVGIFLAELPFDYLFFKGFTWAHQSVMMTLFLGGLMLLVQRRCTSQWVKILVVIPFAVWAQWCCCDYGGYGILVIAVFALTETWYWRLPLLLALSLGKDAERVIRYLDRYPNWWQAVISRRPIQTLSVFALLPIGLYSGKKLSRSKALQIGFYLFYPAHMVLLLIFANCLL